MNLRQTAEVAALVAIRAPAIIQHPSVLPEKPLHMYWKISQTRLKCWFARLRANASKGDGSSQPSPLVLSQQVRVCRGILVADLLSRVWSAVLTARDAARSEDVTTALVRHVHQGQLEARREVLRLLADERRIPAAEAAMLDRLRGRVERWTDLLVGPLLEQYDVRQFVFDMDRACESARTPTKLLGGETLAALNQLTLLGIGQAIPDEGRHTDDHTSDLLDRAIARAVLSAVKAFTLPRMAEAPAIKHAAVAPVVEGAKHDVDRSSKGGVRFAEIRRRVSRRNEADR